MSVSMSNSTGSHSQNEASLPHEQFETCLKNLFEVPSKNIESAFGLVLGLIKEQSSQIDGLKRVHSEALESNEKIRTLMQSALDDIAREKNELHDDFKKLKTDHEHLLKSYDNTTHEVDELKHGVEVSVTHEPYFSRQEILLTYSSIEKLLSHEDADIQLLRRQGSA